MTEGESGLGFTPEALTAASKARLAPSPEPSAAAPEQPKEPEAAGTTAEGAKPEGQPATPESPDVSWLPDDLRTDAVGLPASLLERLRPHVLRQADYTRKTQEVAAERKTLEQIRADAERYRLLVADPERARAVARILGGQTEAEPAKPSKSFDWTTASSEEIDAEVTRRAEAKAREVAEALLEERVAQPVSRLGAIRNAVVAYYGEAKEQGVSESDYRAAWDECRAEYGDDRILQLDAPTAVALLKPFVRAKALEARLAAAERSKSEVRAVARASSSPGTNGVAPPSKPAYELEGREPTDSEKMERLAGILSKQYGRTVTPGEVLDLLTPASAR